MGKKEIDEKDKKEEKEDTENKEQDEEEIEVPKKIERIILARGITIGILIMALAFLIVIIIINFKSEQTAKENGYASSAVAQKIDSINGLIDKNYVGEKDVNVMFEEMYQGLIDGLGDKYADYYSKDEFAKLNETISGTFYGIGVTGEINENGDVVLSSVQEGLPAEKAGLLAGDIITKVDAVPVKGKSWNEVKELLRGDEGTSVWITYLRGTVETNVKIYREKLEKQSIAYAMIDEENKIGYIFISKFVTSASTQFINAVNELEKQGMKSLIIDVRNNTGGDVDATVLMLDRLVKEETVLKVIEKGDKETLYKSDGENYLDIPIVILINKYSASASEIFIGALKDLNNAITVGEKTYGKGVVQTVYNVGDGSYIKITTGRYYSPSGVCIDGEGFEPDYPVALDESATEDLQFNKALEILRAK